MAAEVETQAHEHRMRKRQCGQNMGNRQAHSAPSENSQTRSINAKWNHRVHEIRAKIKIHNVYAYEIEIEIETKKMKWVKKKKRRNNQIENRQKQTENM